jgi:succinyl-diaminopimelate desuccinylase
VVGAPGLSIAEIETIGKTCHAGMNSMGVNAVDAMVPILDELLVLKQEIEARRSRVPGVPRTETPDERFMSPMFNMDVIRGGEKFNIVPPSCKLTIDRRVIPEESLEDAEREIMDAVERGRSRSVAIDVHVAFHHLYPPLFIDPATPAALRLQAVIKAVNQMGERTLDPIAMPGSTDMGFLNEILHTHDILLRGVANVSSSAHGVNETISVKDVYVLIKEILLFLCGDIV